MLSDERIQEQYIDVADGITLRCELNALSRISRHISLKSKSIIYNSFIASNVNYCPLVWHFCGATNSNKLEKLWERSLRMVYNDFESPIQSLINKSDQENLSCDRLKYFISEVFISVNWLNSGCLHDIFVLIEVPYDMRTSRPGQPIRRTTTYGLRSFSYIGAKLWNNFVPGFNDINSMDMSELNFFLQCWEGPKFDPSYRNCVWSVLADLCVFFCGKRYIYVDLIFMYVLIRLFTRCVSTCFMHILTLHYFAHIHSRILSFWLMLSVVKTTSNKFHLILS